MPKSAKINFSENSLTFDYIVEATPEQIKVNIRSKGKKTYILVSEYEDLKQYYTAILAKMEEQIVFSK
jgi:effector-binding domain-containing protein